MGRIHHLGITILLGFMASAVLAEPAAPLSALARMPVKEVTVFKDGHAFLLHEGAMPTDAAGSVVMDYLPTPVIGTFWPYCAEKGVKLTAVKASQRKVSMERTALSIRELLEANIGAEAIVTETSGLKYPATILGIPRRDAEELEATSPPNSGEKLPQQGNVILLKTEEGVKVVALDRIQDVTFKGQPKGRLASEEFRNMLTLALDWDKRKPGKTADVGMVYLQRGIRWIPSYRISLDDTGNATVKLQATLLNELTDLGDVTANLVIGVPTFAFRETPDPISLQQAVAQLSSYFRQDSQTAYAFSNAIMSQSARMGEYRSPTPSNATTIDLGPGIAEPTQAEDLYIFTLQHVSLKKGQRMTVPVVEYTVPYKDVFVVDLPFAPPAEVCRDLNNEQQAELARLFNAPKAMHKIRSFNKSAFPMTTAPALIMRQGRILAQGLMTYTATGASTDLEVTPAVDIQVRKSERETKRTPNAVTWGGNQYLRIDLAGTISLVNHRNETVELEVTRQVLGNVATADHEGNVQQANLLGDEDSFIMDGYPYWWRWCNWPYWWSHFNGTGRITWKTSLAPGKAIDLGYTWSYYWR